MSSIRFTLLPLLVLAAGLLANACQSAQADSPTEAYKRLFAAVKSKDIEGIKQNLSKKSIEFGRFAAESRKAAPDSSFENGMTGTTFSDTLPEIRDERVKDQMGAVEIWNAQARKWEDLPFIREDGTWKLAIGDSFAGTYRSPGFGLAEKEREAANSAKPMMPPPPAANTNPPVPTGNANKP